MIDNINNTSVVATTTPVIQAVKMDISLQMDSFPVMKQQDSIQVEEPEKHLIFTLIYQSLYWKK